MLVTRSLEDIIRDKVSLGPVNARGFHEIRCLVCSDHSVRGGFRFDGESTGFFCWNCGSRARYEEGSGRLSRNFRKILEAFGVTRDDLVSLRSPIFSQQNEAVDVTLESMRQVKLHTPTVQLPDKSFPIGTEGHEELQLPIAEYLHARRIDPLQARAYFSLDPRMARRVIIPFLRDGKVIYWQARHIDAGVKPRYLNSSVAKDAVIYGYDELYSGSSLPLFVTEGIFDAISIGGIAVIGSTLCESKLEILKRSRRRILFVIDRDKTGGQLGQVALENNWEITFVDARVSDANASVIRFGLPYTVYSLLKNAHHPKKKTQSTISLDLGVLEGRLRNRK